MYVIKDNTFNISVRNLVEFMCLGGDIDNRVQVLLMLRLCRRVRGFTGKSSTLWVLITGQRCFLGIKRSDIRGWN